MACVTCAPRGAQLLWAGKGSDPTEAQMIGKICSFVHPNFHIFDTVLDLRNIIVERFKKKQF